MVHHNSMAWLTVFVCGAFLFGAFAATMAEGQNRDRNNAVLTPLERPVLRNLRGWVRDRSDPGAAPPAIAFKVPAERMSRIVCHMGPSGLNCYEAPGNLGGRCPTAVDVELPDGGQTTVPVDCTGPDADGNCECEFSQ